MSNELEYRAHGDIRMDVSGDRKLTGYAIRFNSLSLDLGGFRERIRPEAVDRTLSQALDVRALVNHDSAKVLGRTLAGTLRLYKDGKGMRVEIFPPQTTIANDLLESVSRGDVSGQSFGFRTLEDEWHLEDGEPIREILDMEVREVSVVTFPAYPQTDVGVAMRSLESFRQTTKGRAYWEAQHRMKLAL